VQILTHDPMSVCSFEHNFPLLRLMRRVSTSCINCETWQCAIFHQKMLFCTILTYEDVSRCIFSHRRTCTYTTCPIISYVWARPTCFSRSVSNTRRVHARVHTLKDRCLLTFWVTKSFPCVTLNIWHHFGHQIFHRQVETMYNRMT